MGLDVKLFPGVGQVVLVQQVVGLHGERAGDKSALRGAGGGGKGKAGDQE